MYLIEDPWSERQFGIIVEDADDVTVCRRALGVTTISYEEGLRTRRLEPPALMSAKVSEAVARGLAYISLGYFGPGGFGSITQDQADQRITDLFGDTEGHTRAVHLES